MNEFKLIEHFFIRNMPATLPLGVVGIGDDAALLPISDSHALAISTDSLLQDTHFYADIPAHALGHKALAVNLSDLAAMGATPKFFTLALHLPAVNEDWLNEFQQGLFACAKKYQIALVGGDTCRSHQGLGINITVIGEVNRQKALLRSRAMVGDLIYVSGHLGESALGLLAVQKKIPFNETWLKAHYYPQPQVELGKALIGVANAAIDISDGLLADLGHMVKASGTGARIDYRCLPLARNAMARNAEDLSQADAISLALTGGEDYQLCFTVPIAGQSAMLSLAEHYSVIKIGEVIEGDQIVFEPLLPNAVDLTSGFRHFE